MPAYSPDIAAVLDYDSSVSFSPYVEMSESEGGIWLDHLSVVDDHAHDCDSVSSNVVESGPNLSPPVIASEEDWYNHHYDTLAPYKCNLQCQCSK